MTNDGSGLAQWAPVPSPYPRWIEFSSGAEKYLMELCEALLLDRVQLHQLPPSLSFFYALSYEQGRDDAAHQLAVMQEELDRVNFTADRLYAEMCRRTPPKQAEYIPFATLTARRAYYETEQEAKK